MFSSRLLRAMARAFLARATRPWRAIDSAMVFTLILHPDTPAGRCQLLSEIVEVLLTVAEVLAQGLVQAESAK